MHENISPFCKGSNECMAHSENPYWCVDAVVPDSLLDLVPSEFKRKVCICSTCINLFIHSSDTFTERYIS